MSLKKKIVILTEGKTNPDDAKTATGVIRYRRDEVVGILDTTCAGRTAEETLGVGGDLPCIGSLDEVDADTLLLGIAPAGGELPESWRQVIRDAISRGLDVVSGLHYFIGDDEEFRRLADERGVRLVDVRRPPPRIPVSQNLARKASCFRVHTVGHDCGVGKMLTALEVTAGLRQRGRRATFVATGQTGILIAGRGVPIDAVVSDFVSGAIEREVLALEAEEFVVVEGQGSLIHPLYSGVTLGLLHGCAPQAMILTIDPTRRFIRHTDVPMPPIERVIDIYERLANVLFPSTVVGVSLNTSQLELPAAEEEVDRIRERTGLPATDVVRFGAEPLVEAVLACRARAERAARGSGGAT